jgi:hypothetical protein
MMLILDDIETLIKRADLLAQAAHFGQTDNGGKPRIEHVRYVARQFAEPENVIVALLHDTLEDSPITTVDCLRDTFGSTIATAVFAITRKKGERYFDYIRRCWLNPTARLVKIEDIKHNMDKSRWPEMPDSYYEREVKALAILLEDIRSLCKDAQK